MMRAPSRVQLKETRRAKDVMLMMVLVVANSVCWYGHVLRREDGYVLRRALAFEVVFQRKKWFSKETHKK